MENTSFRSLLRSNEYTPSASQRAIHFASRPSSAGFSGSVSREETKSIKKIPLTCYLAARAMPWKCPACHTEIRHSDVEAKPREHVRYRCHICRLELMFDATTDRMKVTPIEMDSDHRLNRSS